MSPQSGRKNLAQGAVSGANGTLGSGATFFQAWRVKEDVIPGFRFAPPGATVCHPLCGFVDRF